MDKSLTPIHVCYIWKLGKYFGQELICCQMTNIKAWFLSLGGMTTCAYLLHNCNFCPRLFEAGYVLSGTSFFLETTGVLFRAYDIYVTHMHAFSLNCCCEACVKRQQHIYSKDL